jgi:uncharacterized membrane protein
MSYLVAITFADPHEAEEVRKALDQAQHEHLVRLDDSAVVVKDEDGTVHVRNEVSRGVKVGAIGGGAIGLLAGFLLGGPIGGLVVGALGGALGGDLAGLGIDGRFIRDVSEAMQAGTSALFLMVKDEDPGAVIDALDPFEGQVYHTSLPEEVEEKLRQALSD